MFLQQPAGQTDKPNGEKEKVTMCFSDYFYSIKRVGGLT